MSRPVDMTWMDGAPCVGKGRLFFAQKGERAPERKVRVTAAVDICRTCPLQTRCRKAAEQRGESAGIWGGVIMDVPHGGTRPGAGRRPGIVDRGHGTYQGYKQHYRAGTEVCPECDEAGRDYRRALAQIKRADWSLILRLRAAARVESVALRNRTTGEQAA